MIARIFFVILPAVALAAVAGVTALLVAGPDFAKGAASTTFVFVMGIGWDTTKSRPERGECSDHAREEQP